MRLDELRTALEEPLPMHARAKITRMLDHLELVIEQITELERQRDAVLGEERPDKAAEMIQQLASRGFTGTLNFPVVARASLSRAMRSGRCAASSRRS
jgi:transposase